MTRHDLHGPYPKAPVHVLDGIWLYATQRVPPGSFVQAVLENNLSEAFNRADNHSLVGLLDIVRYVRWEIPSNCHGSRDKVTRWLRDDSKYFHESGYSDAELERDLIERRSELQAFVERHHRD